MNVQDIRNYFIEELKNECFTTDRSGSKTIEMIGASFVANEPAIFGEVNQSYVNAELDWYNSMSTNINDIYGDDKPAPAAWQYTGNKHGEINSNYGYLIYSDVYGNQYNNALNELVNNPDSRRASMIYTRPGIWTDFNDNGKNDFICTNSVTYYIRHSQMHCAVQMRSNDTVFGYKNDWAWQQHVLEKLRDDFNEKTGRDVDVGKIRWQVQNLHVYERHFHLVK